MKNVKVLGPGCSKCKTLAANVHEAVAQLKTPIDFEYVTDMDKILSYGIMMTPGLIIDGKVVSTGRLVPVKEIIELLKS